MSDINQSSLTKPSSVNYIRLLSYLKPYWLIFTIGLIAAIPAGAMDGAIAWLAGQGLQKIFIDGRQQYLVYVPLVVLAIGLMQGVFRFTETYFIRLVGALSVRDLRNELFEHIEKQPLLYFLNQSSGIFVSRMINDINIIENANARTFQSVISRVVTLISLSVVIMIQSFKLSVIALSILSFIIFPVIYLGRKIRRASRKGQEAIGDLVMVLSESIQGARIIQSYNLNKYQVNRFFATNESYLHNMKKTIFAEAILSPILTMIGALGIACVLWMAGYEVVHKQITLGAVTSFVISLVLLYSPLKTVGRINAIIQPALSAAGRIFELLDVKSNLVEKKDAIALANIPHEIKFDSVYFSYPESKTPVLKDINLLIKPGQMVALVGRSGSGKSTLASLIPRFFDTSLGRILIDNTDIKDIQIHSLRSQIAIVSQDNFLFNTTIEENIKMGNTNASFAEIEAASRQAFCAEFIENLPHKYKTIIGERGVNLSGGQQQRIAIARAFLKNAPILILDEATSSLDTESETMVKNAIDKLMHGRTVIVIAHRLSTVSKADKIVVLDHGSIVESGSHENLLKTGGIYSGLIKAQFNDDNDNVR